MNKLSRKDIAMLEALAVTEESKGKLAEYIQQREKAAKAYKVFREAVVNGVEVDRAEKVVEVKRKFKAGDKVRVLDTENALATPGLRIGDVAGVLKYGLMDNIVMLKSPYQTRYAYFDEPSLELVEEKSANEIRAEIIQRAKEFVKENKHATVKIGHRGHSVSFEFVVNAEKRTVVALLKGYKTLEIATKGIAKCHPDDVFSEHIGKAIALGRALGKDVSEFENAVQPSEPVIGHKLSNRYRDDIDEITSFIGDRMCVNRKHEYWLKETLKTGETKIIDDTHAIYKEESE